MADTPVSHRPGVAGTLESLVGLIEVQSTAMRCTILLLDEDG